MEGKTAKEVLAEIEKTRKEFGTVSMILDGAQVHFMLESYIASLYVVAELRTLAESVTSDDWNLEYGTREEVLKNANELGLIAISSIKIFLEALPDNLKDLNKEIKQEILDRIEGYFIKD